MLEKEDIEIIYSHKKYLANKLKCEHDADDVIQLVLEKFLRNNYADKLAGRSIPEKRGYISLAVNSELHDFWRKKKKKPVVLTTHFPDEPDVVYDESEVNELIKLCDKVLKGKMKEVVELRFQGKRFSEIAQELNIPLNTSLGRYRYAVRRLRKNSNELQEV